MMQDFNQDCDMTKKEELDAMAQAIKILASKAESKYEASPRQESDQQEYEMTLRFLNEKMRECMEETKAYAELKESEVKEACSRMWQLNTEIAVLKTTNKATKLHK